MCIIYFRQTSQELIQNQNCLRNCSTISLLGCVVKFSSNII